MGKNKNNRNTDLNKDESKSARRRRKLAKRSEKSNTAQGTRLPNTGAVNRAEELQQELKQLRQDTAETTKLGSDCSKHALPPGDPVYKSPKHTDNEEDEALPSPSARPRADGSSLEQPREHRYTGKQGIIFLPSYGERIVSREKAVERAATAIGDKNFDLLEAVTTQLATLYRGDEKRCEMNHRAQTEKVHGELLNMCQKNVTPTHWTMPSRALMLALQYMDSTNAMDYGTFLLLSRLKQLDYTEVPSTTPLSPTVVQQLLEKQNEIANSLQAVEKNFSTLENIQKDVNKLANLGTTSDRIQTDETAFSAVAAHRLDKNDREYIINGVAIKLAKGNENLEKALKENLLKSLEPISATMIKMHFKVNDSLSRVREDIPRGIEDLATQLQVKIGPIRKKRLTRAQQLEQQMALEDGEA
ncbi:hypothetical protein GGR53DRAFT_185039 [Hypoxylon sp. FL1150]|nr:hypothetical protein GGR53DRAFT_185039 [Hypoxylon sp. FL1150]